MAKNFLSTSRQPISASPAYGYPSQGGVETGGSGFMQPLRLFLRHATLIVLSTVVAGLLALIISLCMRPKYEAGAHIGVDLGSTDLLGNQKQTPTGTIDIPTRLETQLHILQSDGLAEEVIQQLNLTRDCRFNRRVCTSGVVDLHRAPNAIRSEALEAYHSGLSVQVLPRTQILDVSFRSTDPQLATDIANAIASSYIDRSFRVQFESVQKASAWLTGQLVDVKKQAEAAQARFGAYQQQVGIVGADENHNVMMNRLDELNRQLSTVEAERIIKEAQYRVALAGNPELIAAVVPDSVIQTLRKQQADLRMQQSDLSSKYGENYPRVIQLNGQMQDVQTAISQEVENIRRRMQQEFLAAKSSQQMLQSSLDQQKRDALRVDASAVQYAILQRDVQTSRDLYESLIRKLKEAGIDQGLRTNNLELIDRAELPLKPVSPKLVVNTCLGLLTGLLVGIASAFVIECSDHSIRTPGDVEAQSLLPALAMIPRLPAPPKRVHESQRSLISEPDLPVTLEQPTSKAAEAYRTLRTSILSSARETPRVICFVSGGGREGKSTCAVNTAVVLAQQGSRVLLIDADLRCPTVHRHLDMHSRTGLADCLGGETPPSVQRVKDTTLFVLPAGKRPSYIPELLGSAKMKSYLRSWRDEYEFVIIDTPPLLTFTDGVVVAGMADTAVVVVRSTRTSGETLVQVRKLLERSRATISGVVLNDVEFNPLDHGAYYDQRAYDYYAETVDYGDSAHPSMRTA